jgi:ankyrin repeat protein
MKLCFCMGVILISLFVHSAYCMQMSIFDAAKMGSTFQIKRGIFSGEINTQDDKKRTPLFYAVMARQKKAVERLVVGKADVHKSDSKGIFPLEIAAYNGDNDIVTILLSAGAKCDQRDSDRGWTALFAGIAGGHRDVVASLITAKFDVNEVVGQGLFPRDGMAPLEAAALQGRSDIVTMLLDAGADVNKVDALGWTALLWAVFNAHQEVALQLLKAGANPWYQEKHFGFTPLYWAVNHGQLPVIEELMKRGADPKVIDKKERKSLWQKAQDMGRVDIVIALSSGKQQEIPAADPGALALAKKELLAIKASLALQAVQ